MSNFKFGRGADAATQAAADSERRSKNNFIRFYIKDDKGKKVVRFLDGDNFKTDPFTFPEHDVWVEKRIKGKRRKVIMNFTCLQVAGEDCPFCGPDNMPKTRYAYSILDRAGYETKDGKVVKEIRKLYVIGVKQFKQLETFRKEGLEAGKLMAQDIKIVRNGEGTATTYSYFAGTVGALKPDADAADREDFSTEPFDYEDMLKPLSRAEALAVLRGSSKLNDDEEPKQRNEVDEDEDDEENIPF